jgi:hypothetical protein
MEACVECTHCRVLMTGWSAPGSPVRYWQCPFCGRTHSSLYAEVFRRAAGARAASWFARLEREGQAAPAAPGRVRYQPAPAGARLPSRHR